MTRRDLLGGAALWAAPGGPSPDPFSAAFREILDGFLACAAKTSASGCVCDYPNGTRIPYALAKSGKSYASVSRMLPALATWIASGRDDGRAKRIIQATFTNAFDPQHADYWMSAPASTPDLRQVESSLVAWTLWVLRDWLPASLGMAGRANVNRWLASCTEKPVRANNFAWFTAVNHAVRLRLSRQWPEFQGDARSMLADIEAMDAMHAGNGWYSDGVGTHIFDYYSFWVFTSHYLYWREIIGADYPEWMTRFDSRVRALMEVAPLLFAENGSHPLMGVSLIYRWAILTPLILAYRQKLWPHAPGLLRALAARNIEFFRTRGAFDPEFGKLRETISAEGTPEFPESYIDNGHPYWGMQAFALFLIPITDRFWTAPALRLPVEEADFVKQIAGPGLMIWGSRKSGDVRLAFAQNGRFDSSHRDRYTKFTYSAQFPFCISKNKQRATWDSTLILRDPSSGCSTARAGVLEGRLIPEGVETRWWAEMIGLKFDIRTRVRLIGEDEIREHHIQCSPEALRLGIEIREGSAALPLSIGQQPSLVPNSLLAISNSKGSVGVTSHSGYDDQRVHSSFQAELGRENINVIAPRCAIVTLSKRLSESITVLRSHWMAKTSL